MDASKQLSTILAPAGGGVPLFSTGLEASLSVQRAVYKVARNEEIEGAWKERLGQMDQSKVHILGAPSDCGAGFVRGANQGPIGLRRYLLSDCEGHPYFGESLLDLGDIRVIPHLLSEEMLSAEQIQACRQGLYLRPDLDLPVSPLGQLEWVLSTVGERAPNAVIIVVGGDHSVAWPAFSVAHRKAVASGKKVGLLHFDAHTDLLDKRLGVRYCFATWAYHANELLERDGRLVQVGIRASGRDRAHWEQTLNVRQYWPQEYLSRSTESMADEICQRFSDLGVDCLYVSNDIDGTDRAYASATGTPEDGGLHPDQVSELTRRVGAQFPLIGADLVELAPPLAQGPCDKTLATAARYLGDLIELAHLAPSDGNQALGKSSPA